MDAEKKSQSTPTRITVVGGGLGGALMAIYLGKAGHHVALYERRHDPRRSRVPEGRSINLAISARGLHALGKVGLAERVLEKGIPMRGRMLHPLTGDIHFQPYGTQAGQVINSVSRHELNAILLDEAERSPNVQIHFGRKCTGVDLDRASATFLDLETEVASSVDADFLVAADGAFSVVRGRMQRQSGFDYQQTYLEHGYKELVIPAGRDGEFAMERNALHIWPRGGFMMIALPNHDGTFTCTCFWPLQGPLSFHALQNENQVLDYFRRSFPDAVPIMPDLSRDYFHNPTGSLVTIRCAPWHHQDKVVLLGDACHAVVPFYGQGANAAFEDCVVLDLCLKEHAPDWGGAFLKFQLLRKVHTDALADLSLANFIEMRDRTTSTTFMLKKQMGKTLHRLLPKWFVPLYTLVSFTRTPYAEAVARARRQQSRLWAAGLALLLLIATLSLAWTTPWK